MRNYQWGNFDTTLDRILKDQPAAWLPKEFSSYADLLKACYDEAIANLTTNLGADPAKWTWGDLAKARFPHPLGTAPLIGCAVYGSAGPAKWNRWIDRCDCERRFGCVDAFDCRSK